MVVDKQMRKYPKFNVIDPYNAQMENNQICENHFSGYQSMSKEQFAVGYTQMSFCIFISPFLMNHPTPVLNLSNSYHVEAPLQHKVPFTSAVMHCLSHNNTSLKYFFSLETSSSTLSKEMYLFNPLFISLFSYELIQSKAVNMYI